MVETRKIVCTLGKDMNETAKEEESLHMAYDYNSKYGPRIWDAG